MSNININGFTFKLAKPKVIKDNAKKYQGICYCFCFKQDDTWKAYVTPPKNCEDVTENIICDFTEKSYDLSDKKDIFTVNPNKQGIYTRWSRTEYNIKNSVSNSTFWIPFCRRGIYSGHLSKKDNKYYFDIKEYIGGYSYNKSFIKGDPILALKDIMQ